jgi:hypothetical protein
MTTAVQTRSNQHTITIPEQFSSLASILAITIFQWIIISALGGKRSNGNSLVDAKPAASRHRRAHAAHRRIFRRRSGSPFSRCFSPRTDEVME